MIPLTHGALRDGVQGGRHRRAGLAARQRRLRGHGARRPRPDRLRCRTPRPSGLYCGDETDGEALRDCEQIYDAALRATRSAGPRPSPAPRDRVRPERRRHDLDLQAARRREVPGRLGLRRQRRRRRRSPPSGTPKNPLHVGNAGTFDYFPALLGGFLNPPCLLSRRSLNRTEGASRSAAPLRIRVHGRRSARATRDDCATSSAACC